MIDPQRIWSSSHLPTLPAVAVRLLEMSKRPDTQIRDIVDLIRSDPAITAKILKSTNSSYFGLRSPVTSLERAVPLLGTNIVTSLALSFSLVEAAMSSGPLAKHYRDYWMRSVVQAAAAETLGEQRADGLDCEYFLGGLLADLGCLAMLRTIADEYVAVLQETDEQQRNLQDVESERLGINHVQVSVQLMHNWNLPPALRRAVEFHHSPLPRLLEQSASPEFPYIKAMAVSAAVGDYFCSSNKGPALARLRELTAKLYGFSARNLDEYIERVRARMDKNSELFSIDAHELGEPAELMARANEHLAELALRAHIATTQATARQEEIERENRELELRNQDLQQKASRDPLTGLHNRASFDEQYQNEIRRCAQCASTIGIILLDIDRFKQVNDTYGHPFGDQVLQLVAQTLRHAARPSDVLARYGGEEFIVLAVQPTERGLAKAAERLRAAVESQPVLFDGDRVPITISLGTALALPPRDPGGLADELIAAADEALYESKEGGRNQVRSRSLLEEPSRRLIEQVAKSRLSRWLVDRGALDVKSVSRALVQYAGGAQRLGDLAQQQGWLTRDQIGQVLRAQEQNTLRFGETAIQLGVLSEQRLYRLLALQQEEPLALARVLVRLELLGRRQAAELLAEYLAEVSSGRTTGTLAAV